MPDRFVREIEEILKETEDSGSLDSRKDPSKKDFGSNDSIGRPAGFLKSSNMMLAGIAFLLIAALMRQIFPGMVQLLLWTGIVMFIGAYFLFFIKPSSNKYQKKWRGQAIDTEADVSIWRRFINSFRRRV